MFCCLVGGPYYFYRDERRLTPPNPNREHFEEALRQYKTGSSGLERALMRSAAHAVEVAERRRRLIGRAFLAGLLLGLFLGLLGGAFLL